MSVRTAISKELEKSRSKGDIGSSLNAELELYCNAEFFDVLNQLSDELRFIFITSQAAVFAEQLAPVEAIQTEVDGVKLVVTVSEHKKCVRCWHQRADVGQHEDHEELCGRCVENVSGSGEQRHYA